MVGKVMMMDPPRSLLFLSPFLILHLLGVTVLAQPAFLGHFCSNMVTNYTASSTYKANLNTLLSSLSSNNEIDYGFYHFSVGQNSDQINAIALCRGDVVLDACRSCVNDSRIQLTQLCSNQTGAVGWYDNCMLHFSNESIFGTADTAPALYMWNPYNASDVEDFNKVLGNLMVSLRRKAASGDSQRKFATGEANVTSFESIYGLMQCTPDLSELSCSNCLEGATNEIPACCDGKQGGRVIKPSCNLRFETFRFYEYTAANAPPPPPSADQAPPPLANPTSAQGKNSNTSRTVILTVVPSAVISMTLIITFLCCFLKRRQPRESLGTKDKILNVESLRFNFGPIKNATNNFSDSNKLGQGGFGAVYKGSLSNGQDIAVKRLSKGSRQGELEFKNEVLLVAKLQHKNLVRLLGFCLEGIERLLIYEFVPNASLDHFLFDPIKRSQLYWKSRYKIIVGIARGLLYLHEDSQLRIIHRDLKASNVLLDEELNPKIADFGMARLFSLDQTQGDTSRIVGTYGYMAPEYAMHGKFSVKSDVFSFGVLVLEIISGQKNSCFRNGENVEDLKSFAWKSWRDGSASNLIDPLLSSGSRRAIMRCLHIGLLCVQENVADRPTMASVVLMLSSYSITLPLPSRPAFFMHSSVDPEPPLLQGSDSGVTKSSDNASPHFSINDVSITELHPR